MTLYVASQRVFIVVVYFVNYSVRILLDTPSYGPKREEVAGSWRRLHNEELYYLHALAMVIKSRRRWTGHIARMPELRSAYKMLVGKTEVKRPFGKPRCIWEDNIRMNVKK
jgi:hypothetical protein